MPKGNRNKKCEKCSKRHCPEKCCDLQGGVPPQEPRKMSDYSYRKAPEAEQGGGETAGNQ